jgi:ATP-dependent Clp protease adaptor protein ClpS
MSGGTQTEKKTDSRADLDLPWNVVVWDDPVNLMSYVVYVFQKVFGYNRSLATKLMREVHEQGKSLVASEPREQAELHVHQLHTYGLQATLRKGEV